MPAYGIPELVADLKRIVASEADPRAVVEQVTPLAERLAADTSWVKPAYYECDADQGFGIHVLHEEPDNTLLVESIAWLPGRGVLPHDHQTWGVVVGIAGDERNVDWRRRDDGSQPGHADLEPRHEIVVGRGQVIAFMPDDIHSVHNDGVETTLSLHIYGKTLAFVDRSQFDPVAKTVVPCPKRIRVAAA